MAQLTISLLGTVRIARDDRRVTAGLYAKAVGLLAYLAVEADRPHTRATLAALFWPEQTEEKARHSLRQALSTLRRVLGEQASSQPYLMATRESIQFNPDAGYVLDVRQLSDLQDACDRHAHHRLETCPACAQRLEQAAGLFRGDFLAGFSVDDSTEFEDWAQIWRQRIRHKVIGALSTIADWHEQRGALDRASAALVRQLELDPWQEEAHRRLMELLWRQGQRPAALAQFERCRAMLDEELGVEPEDATTALDELIRTSEIPPQGSPLPTRHTPFTCGACRRRRTAWWAGNGSWKKSLTCWRNETAGC